MNFMAFDPVPSVLEMTLMLHIIKFNNFIFKFMKYEMFVNCKHSLSYYCPGLNIVFLSLLWAKISDVERRRKNFFLIVIKHFSHTFYDIS